MPDLFELPDRPPIHRRHHRPKAWAEVHRALTRRWQVPFVYFDWLAAWGVYTLGRLSFLELLEICGSFSILVAVVFYIVDAPERTKMRHYQAWQVINSAQGKGGSGGRIEALHELNHDHVSLLGVDVSDSFLQGVDLHGAELARANLAQADMRNANLSSAHLAYANLHYTNLVGATLAHADLDHADLRDADLTDADLEGLVNWQYITDMHGVAIDNVHHAPEGFVIWAIDRGAVLPQSGRIPK